MDFTYQPLTLEDDLIVWEMLRYAAHESSVKSVQQQPSLALYALDWGREGDIGYVAFGDLSPIGAAWLRLWLGEDKGFGYVNDKIPELAIAVLPDFRGQGVGTKLLKQILSTAKTNYPAISLSVRANNPVLGLYERTGFIKIPGSEVVNRVGEVSFNMMCEFI
ncbi:MAG: GNAT family N-acetyltransferase [Hyellaceae cyanobacterium CSU_1_1]|nr:GNAT family N-acetyltransferase [Pleurocapsa sp. CRU_1_2]NJR44335.1 GNAT family N-acetyltransferase [Hyellaceae cyanobacterium CSU_1_1]